MDPQHGGYTFTDATPAMRAQLTAKLNAPGRHRLSEQIFHLDDGFTIVAVLNGLPVGVVSIVWKTLPAPLGDSKEAFIDLIDVDPEHRRHGIAHHLIDLASERARRHGATQLRGWTSCDRPEALHFWRSLHFTLCPAEVHPLPNLTVQGFYIAKRL